ncbi:threonine synthase, partial [Candidatus Bathyarchaeota archaeon]|nr:threonine synthase [Candidatus Bathyarchaeota archaeon]
MTYQECINCGKKYDIDKIIYFCKKCGDLLEIKYDYDKINEEISKSNWQNVPLSVWRYRDFMPIKDFSKIVSLQEGGTGFHH